MITIDGSFGEGGGQILRTSLSLSLVTGQPFRIDNIRAGRERPGLLRQHLTAVLAAAEISGAEVDGAELGSSSLTFRPGAVRAGAYRFTIGTAGSGTLVLQTVLPALMLAAAPSELTIEGGTHNPGAPPFHFLQRTFAPLLARMGVNLTLELERYGFYPAGGGRFTAKIEPCAKLRPLELDSRSAIVAKRVRAVVANLPGHIAVREVETAAELLGCEANRSLIDQTKASAGPGNIVMVEVESAELTAVFSAFGELGVAAEKVAQGAVREARKYIASGAVADQHLTDQLLLPMALAGSGSFTAQRINSHAETNMATISKFLAVEFSVSEASDTVRRIAVTRSAEPSL